MFCENCGEKVSKDDSFCTNCGSPIKREEPINPTEEIKQETEQKQEAATSSNEGETKVVEASTEPVKSVSPVVTSSKGDNIKKGSTGKVFLVILALVIVLAGIGVGLYFFLFKDKNEKSIEAIQKAVENMENLKSYTMIIKGDIKAKGDENIEAALDWETNVDIENKMSKMNVKVSYLGVEIELPIYIDFSNKDNGLIYFKLPEIIGEASGWSKISLGPVDIDDFVNSMSGFNEDKCESSNEDKCESNENKFDLDKFNENIKDIDFIEKKKSDVSGSDYYEITISEKTIKEIAKVNEDLEIEESDIEEMELGDGFVIGVYIDKKGNYISKISIDLADYLNKIASKENADITFEKLAMSIEYKNINKVDEITIPSEAKKAEEINLNDLFELPNIDNNDNNINPGNNITSNNNENYVEDYSITDYGFKVKYSMPKDFEASSVNDAEFKIYRNDNLRVQISNYWEDEDERFEDIEWDKEYYSKDENYKNITLSDEKTIKVNDKKFAYKELSYENDYNKYYKTMVCYQLDKEHVYTVEYEKTGSPITEDELKLFLDITVSKTN